MNEQKEHDVKRPKKKNKPCGYVADGQTCTKSQQYGPGNVYHYCHKHFNLSRTAQPARDVPPESTSVVETNTSTSVKVSNLGSHHDDNEGAATAGINTTTTVGVSNINNGQDEIGEDQQEFRNDDTSVVETNRSTSVNVYNLGSHHDDNEGAATAGINTTTTVEASNINNRQDEIGEDQQEFRNDDTADSPATFDATDTVASTIVPNSPQSRTISSASGSSCNQATISFIFGLVQDKLGEQTEQITNLKRSMENLERLSTKKRRVNGPHAVSLTTTSTPSDDQNRIVQFPNTDGDFIINAGLKNNGNTCYLNAYLQIIASLPFLPKCLSEPPTISSAKFPLYCSLATVISSMVKKEGKKPIVDPSHFIATFVSACRNFVHSFEGFNQRKLHHFI
jgi:hypothetical protein